MAETHVKTHFSIRYKKAALTKAASMSASSNFAFFASSNPRDALLLV
jgi:hypothetical protein